MLVHSWIKSGQNLHVIWLCSGFPWHLGSCDRLYNLCAAHVPSAFAFWMLSNTAWSVAYLFVAPSFIIIHLISCSINYCLYYSVTLLYAAQTQSSVFFFTVYSSKCKKHYTHTINTFFTLQLYIIFARSQSWNAESIMYIAALPDFVLSSYSLIMLFQTVLLAYDWGRS